MPCASPTIRPIGNRSQWVKDSDTGKRKRGHDPRTSGSSPSCRNSGSSRRSYRSGSKPARPNRELRASTCARLCTRTPGRPAQALSTSSRVYSSVPSAAPITFRPTAIVMPARPMCYKRASSDITELTHQCLPLRATYMLPDKERGPSYI